MMASPSPVTISFKPSEAIAVGTVIKIQATRVIDPESTQNAISIVHVGSQVDLTVKVNDTVIEVSTAELAPGHYDFVIGELPDTSQNRLPEPTTRHMTIRKASGEVSADSWVGHAVNLAIGETSTTKSSPGERSPPGTRIIGRIKPVDASDGRMVDSAFDKNGKKVDGPQLLAGVSRCRSANFGRLHEILWNHLQSFPDELVDIVVWPRIKRDVASYHKITATSEELPEGGKNFLDGIHNMRFAIIDRLRQLNAHIPQSSIDVPPALRGVVVYVCASVAAAHIRTLAESEHVGMVLLDDRTTTNDLTDSMPNFLADNVQSNPGNGVRVTVPEDGPAGTTDNQNTLSGDHTWTVGETSSMLERSGTISSSCPTFIAIGSYGTTNHWATVSQGAKNSAILSFGPREPTAPRVVTGLNMLDMGNTSENNWSIRIASFATNIDTEKFTMHISSWANTMLYNARVSWFRLATAEPDIQCGTFDSNKTGTSGADNIYKTVTFPRAFAKPPIVFVGLSGFDLGGNWCINLYTSKITESSFNIHVDAWGNSKLSAAQATWIAIPVDKSNVLTGDFNGDTKTGWSGSATFAAPFDKTPTVFTALTKFNADHLHNLRVRVNTQASELGLKWSIEKWSDTVLHEIQAAYLVMAL